MMTIALSLAVACGIGNAAADKPQSAANAPTVVEGAAPAGLRELHERFIEALDDDKRRAALNQISRTLPQSTQDVQWLYDLFIRFPQDQVRQAVLASLRRLDESNVSLESAFIQYLKLPENEAKVFGITGATRLRSARALPLITEIARQHFAVKSPGETPILSDRNAWWAQYEALSSLAQLQGAATLPLLKRKSEESPAVARLLGLHLWKESLPQIAKWAASKKFSEQAHEALTSDVPLADLRATRPEMLRLVRDPKSDRELRHLLALKVGFCSSAEEINGLLAEEDAATDPETKLMLSAALFASRSPRTIPWLKALAAGSNDPRTRMGALTQLGLLLPPAEQRELWASAAAHEADPDNRQRAADMLRAASQPTAP